VTTKLHLAITADGHVVEGFLSGGNVHDVTVADSLFEDVYGCYVLEDMGYDSDAHRHFLRSQNNVPVIPGRKNRKVPIIYDKTLYKMQKLIEIFFGKLKENKRLSCRFDKCDAIFMSFIALAALKIII
jgi:transposase